MNQTTKTGFSSSFGCCARHFICEMGAKECYYQSVDPEVPKLCAAHQRNHGKASNAQPIIEKKEEVFKENTDGQLSLF
ncbi:hypothetical protein [Virgibacillus halodenitrificans]|uniref:hypothetical protein n=1 Tax=Virgibacillus halodenitrificans TaxID=1482 RepID=UPI000EF4EDD6|nr:hypothetical protein [Virgibacillus halodenitrificans]